MSTALRFLTPPPGLAPLVDFTLDGVDGAAGLFTLQAAADPAKRLFVLDAAVYLPDYAPVISDEQCALLEVADPDQVQLLVVANPGRSRTTVNLMAPVVVNAATGTCAQLILDGQDWPLRAELGARAA